MDHHRFDDMARSIGTAVSRRKFGGIAAAAGLGAVMGATTFVDINAKKKRNKKRRKVAKTVDAVCEPNCSDRTCGNDGCGGSCGTCNADQVCFGGTCCVPESRGGTCAGRCGVRTNNCGQAVTCATCATGRVCLGNGSCALACTDNNDCDPCGGGACADNPNVEGQRHCTGGLVSPITTCTGTVDCPLGSQCEDMGGGGVCVDLCV
jgi:hypothetical protein